MQLGQSLMIDIETLGTRAGCVVLSIGACEFSAKGIGEQFYTAICPQSCVDWGLKIEPRTTLWWMDQSQDARDFITKGKHAELDFALTDFAKAFKWKGKQVCVTVPASTFQFSAQRSMLLVNVSPGNSGPRTTTARSRTSSVERCLTSARSSPPLSTMHWLTR